MLVFSSQAKIHVKTNQKKEGVGPGAPAHKSALVIYPHNFIIEIYKDVLWLERYLIWRACGH